MQEKHHHKQHNEMALLAISNTHRGKKRRFQSSQGKKDLLCVVVCSRGVQVTKKTKTKKASQVLKGPQQNQCQQIHQS
jgi:hypothetical protein